MEGYFIPGIGVVSSNRSFEKDILKILTDYRLGYYRKYILLLYKKINDKALIGLKKNLKNKNSSQIEKELIKYLDKYKISFEAKKAQIRKKEDKKNINIRVKKYRENTNKVSLQVMVDPKIKDKFDKLKNKYNCTSEEFIKKLLAGNYC